MSVKCLNCGYEMSTRREIISTAAHVLAGIFDNQRKDILGGVMNQKIGKSAGVKCPKCGEIGRWEDMESWLKLKK